MSDEDKEQLLLSSIPTMPIKLTQLLQYKPVYAFNPQINFHTVNNQQNPFEIIPINQQVQNVTTTIVNIGINSIPLYQPSTVTNNHDITTYNQYSFWKNDNKIIQIYPQSIIIFNYTTSSNNVTIDTNEPIIIQEPTLWEYIINTNEKYIRFKYIGRKTLSITQDIIITQVQFNLSNQNDIIIIHYSITRQGIQVIPSYLDTIRIYHQHGNYYGGILSIKQRNVGTGEKEQLYLLSDKQSTKQSKLITIAGNAQYQFQIELIRPRQSLLGETKIQLMYYDIELINEDDDITVNTPIFAHSFNETIISVLDLYSIAPQLITLTIPTTLLTNITNTKYFFFQIVFTPNDLTIEDQSHINTQTFEIMSSCYQLPTNKDDKYDTSKYNDLCSPNGKCLGSGLCECHDNWIGEQCKEQIQPNSSISFPIISISLIFILSFSFLLLMM